MEEDRAGAIRELIRRAQREFCDVRILLQDVSPVRARLKLRGRWRQYEIAISEVILPQARIYSYYALKGGKVVVGFDNTADNEVLRKVYGSDFGKHQYDLIPHKHGPEKQTCEITDEMTFDDFVNWLHNNL